MIFFSILLIFSRLYIVHVTFFNWKNKFLFGVFEAVFVGFLNKRPTRGFSSGAQQALQPRAGEGGGANTADRPLALPRISAAPSLSLLSEGPRPQRSLKGRRAPTLREDPPAAPEMVEAGTHRP